MSEIATKNGSVVIKDGSVAERCECCPSCVPSQMPDYIEVDISSSSEENEYGSVRYRTGRNATFQGECETDYADAYLAFGVQSATYTLTKTSSSSGLDQYAYHADGISLAASVMTSLTSPWGGNFQNKFGRGVYLTILPFRIVVHSKKWPTSSNASETVATSQELHNVSDEIGQVGYSSTSAGNVTHVKKTLGNSHSVSSLPLTVAAYQDFVFPCVGGDDAFGITHPLGSVSGSISSAQPLGASISGSRRIAPSYLSPYVSGLFTDDMSAIQAWDSYPVPSCGRQFPFPYLFSASGSFALVDEYTDYSYVSGPANLVVPFHVVKYDWVVSRELAITGIRGKMQDGAEFPLT